MIGSSTEKVLWSILSSVVFGAFALGFYDPSVRPQVIDFAKIALGGVLTAVSATVASKVK
jgi:hypothetical protein